MFKVFFALTGVEQGGGADLSDGAFQLEAEWVSAAGFQNRGRSSVVLQLHPVEV